MRRVLVSVAALVLCAAAGCDSSGADDGSAAGTTGTTRVTVAVVPVVGVAPLYLGEEKGFFAQHHLELRMVQESGGAAAIPGIVSEQFQFAVGNVASIILAAAQRLPLRIVAAGASSTGDPATDFSGVVVPADSPIRSAGDLAGRSVAVNNLKNIGEVTVRKAVQDAGGDPGSVRFVETAFADMPAALADHSVDAAWMVEPYLAASTAQGTREVAANLTVVPDLTVSAYFTTQEYAEEHPEVVKDFRAAMQESQRYARDHPDLVRAVVPAYTPITSDVALKMHLPVYPRRVDVQSLKSVAGLMAQYGVTPGTVDVTGLLATG